MLKGQAVFKLSLNDSYFAKVPVGNLSFNRITIEASQGFPLEEISSVELSIETEKQELLGNSLFTKSNINCTKNRQHRKRSKPELNEDC